MTKTPAQIDLRQHSGTGCYYDGRRYDDDDAVSLALRGRGRAYAYEWNCFFGIYERDEAEEGVIAPNRDEASAVMRAALARDFDAGCKLGKVVMA